MSKSRTKIISEIEAGENVVSVKKPFQLIKDQRRRYIRLEIGEPIQLVILKDKSEGFWPDGDGPLFRGDILNISAGGVLLESDSAVGEGSIILLKFSLQEIEVIDNVIGLVKRIEQDNDRYMIGVEFVSKEYLDDVFSQPEIDILANRVASFDEQLRKVLNKYVYYKRVSHESH